MSLVRAILVTLLVVIVGSSVNGATCESVETVVPYEFPAGLVNVIKLSENPESPFRSLVEDSYPIFHANYTVHSDGWLQIFMYQLNGTRPQILINGKETYRYRNPIHEELVYSGDFFELKLYPPENLNNTFSIEVNNTALRIYELYTWETMIGEIVFHVSPREPINSSIHWDEPDPISGEAIIFSAKGMLPGYKWSWVLTGDNFHNESRDSHFITPPLDSGNYTVSLLVEDQHGYNQTIREHLVVAPNHDEKLHDPSLTKIEFLNAHFPSSYEINTLIGSTVSIGYSMPVSRDIRIQVVDAKTGDPLTSIEDQVNGEGTKTYEFSFETSTQELHLVTRTEFNHLGEWIEADTESTILSATAPIEEKAIPGFPVFALSIGILVYLLKRRNVA